MKEIYKKNKFLICRIYEIKNYIHLQNETYIMWLMKILADGISEILAFVIEQKEEFDNMGMVIDEEYIFSVLSRLFDAQKMDDFILYGDILQFQMLPVLLDIQNVIRDSYEDLFENYWDANITALKEKDPYLYQQMLECEKIHRGSLYKDDVYSVEHTIVGDITVAVTSGNQRVFLHSNENPRYFAKTLVDSYYDPYKDNYVIYGLGLGYHCEYMATLEEDIQITVIENDIGIIQLAMTYTDMGWYFNNSGVKIVYDGEWTEWGKVFKSIEDVIVLFHQPSVTRIKNPKIQQQIQKYLTYECSMRVRSNRMIKNFLYNQNYCEMDLSSLMQEFKGKNVIIVGAGPSLDKNVELLKQKKPNTIILAMGAVCRKLYGLKIPMDYIIITDPKTVSDCQIQGVENIGVPMILLSTATKGVTKAYSGRKYMLCQKGFNDAEQLANKKDLILFETGGSVATTALDMCIRFMVKKIIFVGLDLALTGNRSHTDGANDEGMKSYDEMIMVDGTDGKLVPTIRPFQMYKEWIERRIKREDVTMPVIDATEGGAKIEGAEIMSLTKVLNSIKD